MLPEVLLSHSFQGIDQVVTVRPVAALRAQGPVGASELPFPT